MDGLLRTWRECRSASAIRYYRPCAEQRRSLWQRRRWPRSVRECVQPRWLSVPFPIVLCSGMQRKCHCQSIHSLFVIRYCNWLLYDCGPRANRPTAGRACVVARGPTPPPRDSMIYWSPDENFFGLSQKWLMFNVHWWSGPGFVGFIGPGDDDINWLLICNTGQCSTHMIYIIRAYKSGPCWLPIIIRLRLGICIELIFVKEICIELFFFFLLKTGQFWAEKYNCSMIFFEIEHFDFI